MTLLLAVPELSMLIALAFIIAFTILLLANTFFTVEQQSAGIIQRFGKFLRIANPGLNVKIPFIDSVAHEMNLRVQQLDVEAETKTKDNVFVKLKVSVQYLVMPEKIEDAYYKLNDPKSQINAYVFDVVRAEVPKQELDKVFDQKDDIAKAVQEALSETMETYGYKIVKALVTDIEPDEKVKKSMNDINAAVREREAAKERGEAEKILGVKKAEMQKESKILQGEGIAGQRKAIAKGIKESAEEIKKEMPDVSEETVMAVLMTVQYFDMLKEVGGNSKSNVIFLNSSPGGVKDLMTEIAKGMITSDKVKDNTEDSETKKETEEHSS